MNLNNILKKSFSKSTNLFKINIDKWDAHLIPSSISLPTDTLATSNDIVEVWKKMHLMRRMEIKIDELYSSRQIRGFCHLYNGQEGVAVGMEEALNQKDLVITAYRDHVNAYLRGISIYEIIAEQLGKKDGSSKAKGGSMHYYSKANNFYGGNGIVGAQVPVGVGLGFSLKHQKNKENVAVTLYGDGAANQGQIYEAANMASIWKLPVIFVCEMNHYAMGTSVERSSAGGKDFHKKLYNVPGLKVYGQSVFEVKEAFKFAKKFAIENGPIVLNIETYRYHGHSMSDPGTTYRIKEMHDLWKSERDPVKNLRQFILENKIESEDFLKDAEKGMKKFIEEQAEKALACEIAPLETLTQDIYDPLEEIYIRAPNYEDSIFVREKLIG